MISCEMAVHFLVGFFGTEFSSTGTVSKPKENGSSMQWEYALLTAGGVH